jgi:hypothetical protein
MTIYELLGRLVDVAPFAEPERFDARQLLAELETLNALGTVAKETEVQAHECRWEANGYQAWCGICHKPQPQPYRQMPVGHRGSYSPFNAPFNY